MTKHYRVEAIRRVEVYQWIEAESRDEAIRIAKERPGEWDEDYYGEPDDIEVAEEDK